MFINKRRFQNTRVPRILLTLKPAIIIFSHRINNRETLVLSPFLFFTATPRITVNQRFLASSITLPALALINFSETSLSGQLIIRLVPSRKLCFVHTRENRRFDSLEIHSPFKAVQCRSSTNDRYVHVPPNELLIS